MKITIELVENRWLVNGMQIQDMNDTEREILNTFFKQIKNENNR